MSASSPDEVRQHAQLDLRVVGRDQHAARLGDERPADLAAQLGAHGDVLQVRVAAAQPAGRGHGLVEARVHAAGRRGSPAAAARRCRCPSASACVRHSRMRRGSSCVSASSSSTSTEVDAALRRAGLLQHRQLQLARTGSRRAASGELMLNVSPASSKIRRLRACISRSRRLRQRRRAPRCRRGRPPARGPPAPAPAATRASSYTAASPSAVKPAAQHARQLQRQIRALARHTRAWPSPACRPAPTAFAPLP